VGFLAAFRRVNFLAALLRRLGTRLLPRLAVFVRTGRLDHRMHVPISATLHRNADREQTADVTSSTAISSGSDTQRERT
jgi:hypothetical protein